MVKKLLGSLSTLACSFFLISPILSADTIDATKENTAKVFFPNSYSYLMLRNYQETDSKNPSSVKPYWQMRYTLGSTFFSNRLDTRVVFGVNKKSDTTALTDRGTRIQMELDTYSNSFYNLVAYSEVYTSASSSRGRKVLLGVNNDLNYSFDTSQGEVSVGLVHDLLGFFGSKANKVKLSENGSVVSPSTIKEDIRDRFNLVEEDNTLKVSQQSPSLLQEISFGVKWEPSFVKNMSVKVWRYFYEQLNPKMEYNREEQTVVMPRSGVFNLPKYTVSYERWSNVAIDYNLNKDTWLTLDTYLGDKVNNKYQYKILTTVGMHLF